ncbi:3,4-dihydroxy-2-butanone-4-phosphate synthase [Pacificimonas flava]|uniref:3,4-dihydroxy-2-butanone 4-phosphate synthase n=2 Tax=Pacificimonas TaxID=1960290 RepID=A0A219B3T0_9SPHN|nr:MULTISPECIES: 3,4-dihydroxy-2-butanone-4-phosphate synthase [Pacificimonas]MBZ6377267.1 3,4-dihydroxy-2-butanone-4-phosphate synthase [Pacificimonas aurantium]OWV33020.1 3,4-dihydroxy-2-butanone-4-phosphate synthase [Pacificimonas flava]
MTERDPKIVSIQTDVKPAAKGHANPALSSVDEIIEEARNGRMFILVDDEDRENEGDLVIPAQMATPDKIAFMAKNGRGLICLSLTRERVDELGLKAMTPRNETPLETAFTVSIEAKEGITTGISAHDRARTISVAIDPRNGPDSIGSPGHVFPLAARDGGVLVRAGHTEAAVDISRLAGLIPAGVICEIMKDDGTMARMDDLVSFAQLHGLKIGTIRDLIAYRRRHDSFVRQVAEESFESEWGGRWRAIRFKDTVSDTDKLALVKGDPGAEGVLPLIRMHHFNLFDDAFANMSPRSGHLRRSMEMIAEAGTGAVVLINKPGRYTVETSMRALEPRRPSGDGEMEIRDYGIGAQILALLGVHDMVLLTNSKQSLVGLGAYGLNIVEQRAID